MKSESSKIFTKTHDIAADLGISLQEYFNNGSDEREETKRFLDDVKNAYRNLSKELHPDANVAIPEEAVDICKRLFIKIEKSKQEIDQLASAINLIKENPTSRRIIISAWNPGELNQMALPPCHAFFQFFLDLLYCFVKIRSLSASNYIIITLRNSKAYFFRIVQSSISVNFYQ